MIVPHCCMRLLAADVADRAAPYDGYKPLVNSYVRTVTDRVIEHGKWCPMCPTSQFSPNSLRQRDPFVGVLVWSIQPWHISPDSSD